MHLSGLTRLSNINIDHTKISDAGLRHFSGLNNSGIYYLTTPTWVMPGYRI